MNAVVEQALELWGLGAAVYHLVAARENQVFRISTATETFALRLHRQGYRTDAELQSELDWMAAAANGGLSVPSPIPSSSGQAMHIMDGIQIDMLTWLSGETLTSALGHNTNNRADLFFSLGKEAAKLHTVFDDWTPSTGFCRCEWNRNGLLGDAPV